MSRRIRRRIRHLPSGPINTIRDVAEDAQVNQRNMIVETEDAAAGQVKMPGNPIKMSLGPPWRSAVPHLRDTIPIGVRVETCVIQEITDMRVSTASRRSMPV